MKICLREQDKQIYFHKSLRDILRYGCVKNNIHYGELKQKYIDFFDECLSENRVSDFINIVRETQNFDICYLSIRTIFNKENLVVKTEIVDVNGVSCKVSVHYKVSYIDGQYKLKLIAEIFTDYTTRDIYAQIKKLHKEYLYDHGLNFDNSVKLDYAIINLLTKYFPAMVYSLTWKEITNE